jgi:hypothetical protein
MMLNYLKISNFTLRQYISLFYEPAYNEKFQSFERFFEKLKEYILCIILFNH